MRSCSAYLQNKSGSMVCCGERQLYLKCQKEVEPSTPPQETLPLERSHLQTVSRLAQSSPATEGISQQICSSLGDKMSQISARKDVSCSLSCSCACPSFKKFHTHVFLSPFPIRHTLYTLKPKWQANYPKSMQMLCASLVCTYGKEEIDRKNVTCSIIIPYRKIF